MKIPFHAFLNKTRMRHLLLALICLTQFNCGRDYVLLPSIRDFSAAGAGEGWLVKQDGEVLVLSHDNPPRAETRFPGGLDHICFFNRNDGWALEKNGQIWITGDHGLVWQKSFLLSNESPAIGAKQIIFADQKTGWLIDYSNVWMTLDGGYSWVRAYPARPPDDRKLPSMLLSISVVDPKTVWLGFENGDLLRTTDWSRNWEKIKAPVRTDIDALYALSANECFISGRGGPRGLFHTTDGGKTWKDVLTSEIEQKLRITSISFSDPKNGWAAGFYFVADTHTPSFDTDVLLKTTDGGKTWTRIETRIIEKTGFTRVRFTSPNDGWLTAERSVYHTADGGRSWTKIVEVEDYNERFK